MHSPDQPPPSSIEAAAAHWLARRDRGLSPEEQDAYLQWLREHPTHVTETARLEQSWNRLDVLECRKPASLARPNPDLLAPRRPPFLGWPVVLAAAAVIAIGALLVLPRFIERTSRAETIVRLGPQRVALEDGSLVELNSEAQLEVNFTAAERRVQLLRGEAHFVVAHDASRPFVVGAQRFAVRAIGTAFAVRLEDRAVSVLVTEGKVQLEDARPIADTGHTAPEASRITAGQKATVRPRERETESAFVAIQNLTSAEIEQALAWQTLRLEFTDLPLHEIIGEFNRFNHRQLVIEDELTRAIKVGGSFRPDAIEPFVRVLELGFGVTSEVRGDEIVLRQRR